MQPGDKTYSHLFTTLSENIKNSFLVLDKHGNIISYNKEAEYLFLIKKENRNIYDVFNEASSEKINKLIRDLQFSSKPIAEDAALVLNSGKRFKAQLTLTSYNEVNDFFIFCSIKTEENKIPYKDVTNIKIKTNDIKSVIKNREILEVINEIKSLYPFTFLGKEKIRRRINRLEELFWIKDIEGNFSLVNKNLAANLGLSISQLEGKKESAFIPGYMINFHKSIESYIKESANCIIIDGIPIKGVAGLEHQQTIEIPLKDADNNVIAIIGFSQKAEARRELNKTFFTPANLIDALPIALAFINDEGFIESSTEEFNKIFKEKVEISERHFSEVLPEAISKGIESFLKSSLNREEVQLNDSANEQLLPGANILLNKIYGKENIVEGISLLIDAKLKFSESKSKIINGYNMLEILIEKNPEPVFIYNKENLKFINVNDAALSLYGYKKEEFLQMDLTDLYEPDDIQTLSDSSGSTSEKGNFSGPFKQKRKDGTNILVEISKISLEYKGKDAFFNIIKDVSDKLELMKKTQIFKAAFDNTEDLLFVTDSSGFINFSNNAAEKFLGYSKSKLENTSFTALLKDEERGKINSTIFQAHADKPVNLKIEIKKNDGEFVEAGIIITPIIDYNSVVSSYSICGKVKSKIGSEEAAGINIETITSDPFLLKDTSQEDIKPDILSSIFHEILTPINVILGFVQELTENVDKENPEQKEALSIIDQNRVSLLHTMNSVIEYSSLEKNKIELKPELIGITELIDGVQKEIEATPGVNKIDFSYGKISSSLKFETDKQKFQNFIFLLLSIITRLSKEKKIYFSAYQIDEKHFIVSFKDNYLSISNSLLKNLSDLFKDENKNIKDLGISKLNLLLSVRLLSILKGSFKVFEKDPKNKDYGFIFPLKLQDYTEIKDAFKTEEAKAEEKIKTSMEDLEFIKPDADYSIPFKEEAESHSFETEVLVEETETGKRTNGKLDLSKLNCLYIEDQVDSQILFKVQMKELNDIKFAVNFENALPLLDNNKFDFIVMDINLPGDYNGLDALRIIHKLPGYEDIPIVAVTAYLLPGDKEKFIAAGFTDFISKPLFKEKVMESLERIF